MFLIKLNKGKHTLCFLSDQKPKIHSIRIYQLEKEEKEINYFPKDNYPIEDGERRQWLTIILVNLGLKFFKIKASCKEGKKFLFFKKDDSDLKLVIDGKIQKSNSKFHQYWYWCGWRDKGKEKIFEKELNLPPNLHYLELWADRSPEVKEIKLSIEEKPACPIFSLKDIKPYIYKGINDNEDYNRFDKDILEAVNFWNKFFFLQKYPPKEPLDPNLIKAMTYVESRMGYEKEGFPDVMQVWDETNGIPQTIKGEPGYFANEYFSDSEYKHMRYGYPKEWLPPKVETPKESIFWGVRWLYHKTQKLKAKNKKLIYPYQREWQRWEDALSKYNPYSWYKDRVLKIYFKGIDQNENVLWKEKLRNEQGGVKTLILLVLFGVLIFGLIFSFYHFKNQSFKKAVLNKNLILRVDFNENTKIGVFQEIASGTIGLAIIDKKDKILKWLPHGDFSSSGADHFNWIKIGDLNKDGYQEIVFELQHIGPGLLKPFYLYQKKNENFVLLFSLLDSNSETYFRDINKDGTPEIIHSFSLDGSGLAGRQLTLWKEIWAWNRKEYHKVNNLYPESYTELINFYDGILKNPPDKESIIYYKPVVECLREKILLNKRGIFANGRDCQELFVE